MGLPDFRKGIVDSISLGHLGEWFLGYSVEEVKIFGEEFGCARKSVAISVI